MLISVLMILKDISCILFIKFIFCQGESQRHVKSQYERCLKPYKIILHKRSGDYKVESEHAFMHFLKVHNKTTEPGRPPCEVNSITKVPQHHHHCGSRW